MINPLQAAEITAKIAGILESYGLNYQGASWGRGFVNGGPFLHSLLVTFSEDKTWIDRLIEETKGPSGER